MRRSLLATLGVLLFLVVTTSAWAQGTSSRVVGLVTDNTGGVVPGATVTLTNQDTGVSFTSQTTGAGTYVFEAVQVGPYTVTVELQGFKKFVSSGNRVAIGEPTTVNAKLELGGVAETVDVSATAPVVQTSSSGNFGNTLSQRVIESLPIVGSRGRNPLTLVEAQPGVVSGANTGGGTHVHGARDRAWNFTLDGIDINESSAGGSNFAPLRTNPDSLAEFKVLTGNFTAEYGRNSGGQVAMITRSGTNQFRGTGFYFHRRPDLNADEWENQCCDAAGITPDPTPKRQFFQHISGGAFGGPIKRNRTFFFGNVQVLRARQTQLQTSNVYTEAARNGIWRYAVGARNQPFGAVGAVVDANGNPLPGVTIGTYNIPANDPQGLGFDPTTIALIRSTPLPNTFDVGDGLNRAGFRFVAEEQERQHDVIAKVDHVINDRHFAFARVAWGRQDTVADSVNGGLARFPDTTRLVDTERSPVNVAGSWRWSPRSNVVNELVVGGNHFTFNFITVPAEPNRLSLSFGDITIPASFDQGNLRTINTYQFIDNLSWLRGAHNFKFGTNIRLQQHVDERGSVAGSNVNPSVNFSTATNTVDPATFNIPGNINTTFDRPPLQNSINFMLGRVGAITQAFVSQGDQYAPGGTIFNFDSRYYEYDFYVQDNWKVRSNMTLDLGLRWEGKLAPRNPDGLIRRPNQRVAVGEAPSQTIAWEEGKLYDDDWNNIAPSVGIAWDPNNDGRSVIRGNYRLAFDRINTFLGSSAVFQSIPGITRGETNTSFGQAGGRLRQGLPALTTTARPNDLLQPPGASNNLITVFDTELDTPLTHGWALSYQRELWRRTVFEATYIGRRASRLFGAYNVNQAIIRENGFLDAFNVVKADGESDLMNRLLIPDTRRNAGESGSAMVRRLFADELNLNAVATIAANIGSRIQGGRTIPDLAGLGPFFFYPFPQFAGSVSGFRVIDSNDYSRYHALELLLDHRHSESQYFRFAYTLSRSRDTRSFDPAFTVFSPGAVQAAGNTPFDIYNRDLNYALSDFDRTHVVQGAAVVDLPFGRGKRWGSDLNPVLDQIVGGWNLGLSVTIQSGRPFTVFGGSNTLSNAVQSPANCDGCSGGEGSVHDESGIVWYFDPSGRARFAAGTPRPGEIGNTGRNRFRGDGLFNLNLGILKDFRTVNGQRFQFRIEATNLTNTPTFGFPTAVTTNPLFGRIRNSVSSTARQVQMGFKYYF